MVLWCCDYVHLSYVSTLTPVCVEVSDQRYIMGWPWLLRAKYVEQLRLCHPKRMCFVRLIMVDGI